MPAGMASLLRPDFLALVVCADPRSLADPLVAGCGGVVCVDGVVVDGATVGGVAAGLEVAAVEVVALATATTCFWTALSSVVGLESIVDWLLLPAAGGDTGTVLCAGSVPTGKTTKAPNSLGVCD